MIQFFKKNLINLSNFMISKISKIEIKRTRKVMQLSNDEQLVFLTKINKVYLSRKITDYYFYIIKLLI
jgi:hypothetical protein